MSKHSMRAGGAGETELRGQRGAHLVVAFAPRASAHPQGLLGVLAHQLDPARREAALRPAHLHRGLGARREHFRERFGLGQREIGHDLGWRRMIGVVLHDEGRQRLRRLRKRGTREESRGAKAAPASHHHHADCIAARLTDDREDIGVALARSGDDLLCLHLLECGKLVAQFGRLLEFQSRGRLFHAIGQRSVDLHIPTFQHFHRGCSVAGIVLARYQPHARR